MSKQMHTKGPWVVQLLASGVRFVYPQGEQAPIAGVALGENSEANARLIAAAPDLLCALESIQAAAHGGNSDIYQIASKAITEALA